ncbi:MerR family transcriptional regulator [Burkholderia alba]|uniref:MerR family transcriptional regulator n=1 Tax=Burkholderia alba TaxID=2683677 RepID=UPI002B05F561|nr:MerR family transcriptional regulator [Burkholderia alba]
MTIPAPGLNASEAAKRLGVSIKALRLYEQHGLVVPGRTAAGYRAYGPGHMVRAAEVAALAAHEAVLDDAIRGTVGKLDKVRSLRADLARGRMPAGGELADLLERTSGNGVAFALPWPWGGEWFALHDIRPLNFIIGSLGSGKTRLALRLAEALPGAAFLGLERLEGGGAAAKARLRSDATLRSRVDRALQRLVDVGASASDALIALLAGLEAEGPAGLVVDMIEQNLDRPTQQALIASLRRCATAGDRPVFLMTRSSAILDLRAVGPDEAIILCPANHSPPMRVAPYPGTPGYEAVATCLASPEVRARIARRPEPA